MDLILAFISGAAFAFAIRLPMRHWSRPNLPTARPPSKTAKVGFGRL
jgi:hypothetical protein